MIKQRTVLGLVAGMLLSQSGLVSAEALTREAVEAWLKSAPAALPAPGTVIGQDGKEALRPLMPPGYFEGVNTPDTQITIEATRRRLTPVKPRLSRTAAWTTSPPGYRLIPSASTMSRRLKPG